MSGTGWAVVFFVGLLLVASGITLILGLPGALIAAGVILMVVAWALLN